MFMTKRLQVLFEDDEYRDIQITARKERVTVAEWVRQALRAARNKQSLDRETKLQAIVAATNYEFPTADIDQMLDEVSPGHDLE